MMKRLLALMGPVLFVTGLLAIDVAKGEGDDLYKANLTSASSLYKTEVEAKISIRDTGKVELKIKGLRSSDSQLVNQNSILIIETEINDSPQTYSKSFTITNGSAELGFTLEGLNKNDRLEITNVVINKGTSPTTTPTVTASPTPEASPVATPTLAASPTPASSPVVTATPTSSPAPAAQLANATTNTGGAILVPGGIISASITATPAPVTTPSPGPAATPTATPATPEVIQAEVDIKPETINLDSKGTFKAFIKLPQRFKANDIETDTVVCEGAKANKGETDASGRFIATFKVQDLRFEIKFYKGYGADKKQERTLTVSGKLKGGTQFEGSDTVKIKSKEKGKLRIDDNR